MHNTHPELRMATSRLGVTFPWLLRGLLLTWLFLRASSAVFSWFIPAMSVLSDASDHPLWRKADVVLGTMCSRDGSPQAARIRLFSIPISPSRLGAYKLSPMLSRWVLKHAAHVLSIVLQKHHAVRKPLLWPEKPLQKQ